MAHAFKALYAKGTVPRTRAAAAARSAFATTMLIAFTSAAQSEEPNAPASPTPDPVGSSPVETAPAQDPAMTPAEPATASEPAGPRRNFLVARRTNRFTVGLLSIGLGGASVEYEGAFNDRASFYLGSLLSFGYVGGWHFFTGFRFFPLP